MNNIEIVHWLNGYMASIGVAGMTKKDLQVIKDELQKVTQAPEVVQPKYAPTPWPIYPPGVLWTRTNDIKAL